jgi:phosphoglycerate dehydrogenase-like enzyme
MKILKTAPGLDPHNYLADILGDGHSVVEADFSRPLETQVADIDVFLTRDVPITAQVLDAAPRLKLVQRYGHHVVNVDLDHALARNVPVANIPSNVSGSNIVVAEHAFFLMMLLAKRDWDSRQSLVNNVLGRPETTCVSGKTLGLIGIGGTGAELARMAKAFGMRVIAVKRNVKDLDGADEYLDTISHLSEIGSLLSQSDYVSIHLPLTPATTGFFGTEYFGMMQPHAYLVNVARGEIIDKSALLTALKSSQIQGAGIDVFWDEDKFEYSEFAAIPNLVSTPHIAGASVDCLAALARAAADNIVLVSEGRAPLYRKV